MALLVVAFTQTHGGAGKSPANLGGVGTSTTVCTKCFRSCPRAPASPGFCKGMRVSGRAGPRYHFYLQPRREARREVKCSSSKVSAWGGGVAVLGNEPSLRLSVGRPVRDPSTPAPMWATRSGRTGPSQGPWARERQEIQRAPVPHLSFPTLPPWRWRRWGLVPCPESILVL